MIDWPSSRDEPGGRLGDGQINGNAREVLRDRLDSLPHREYGARVADRPPSGYWEQVPRFERLWAEHLARWPAPRERPGPERSDDPPGSWRGSGDQYLSPEQHRDARAAIAQARTAEKGISATMREIETDVAPVAHLEGWEHRLKGEDRLKEKVAEKLSYRSNRPITEVLSGVADVIRYTFCSDMESYYSAFRKICARLEGNSYSMYHCHNSWMEASDYKGINTRWERPGTQSFEVQFHTPESLHAKQMMTHDAYVRIRSPATSDTERGELARYQRMVTSSIPEPDSARLISSKKRERF